ncbi:hypothetical protein JOD45_001386 [Scopulibacillus daqui]|uniref:Uncharacterized protein n=1 Tax=Scopulibacillus daqui TaxID=1469162 RepID=A0ABS2PZM7_9BACL|nr:hypothetical protein [Scopulibacillus daqui]
MWNILEKGDLLVDNPVETVHNLKIKTSIPKNLRERHYTTKINLFGIVCAAVIVRVHRDEFYLIHKNRFSFQQENLFRKCKLRLKKSLR